MRSVILGHVRLLAALSSSRSAEVWCTFLRTGNPGKCTLQRHMRAGGRNPQPSPLWRPCSANRSCRCLPYCLDLRGSDPCAGAIQTAHGTVLHFCVSLSGHSVVFSAVGEVRSRLIVPARSERPALPVLHIPPPQATEQRDHADQAEKEGHAESAGPAGAAGGCSEGDACVGAGVVGSVGEGGTAAVGGNVESDEGVGVIGDVGVRAG